MRPVRLLVPLAFAFALGACATAGDTTRVTLPVTQTAIAHVDSRTGADDNLNAVLWMQASAEYDAAALSLYRAAAARLDDALADPRWDALEPGDRADAPSFAGLPPAVIMDVDETVLDNSPYQARLVLEGRAFDEASWAGWVDERAARGVPGVAEFTRAAASRGVTVVYLSNRTEQAQAATLANLRALGLPVADESVFLGKGTLGCEQAGSDKDCRRRQVAARYRVLMQFGDQLGDFVAVRDDAPASRQALVDRHAGWFGERWWMLPNPTYGDWEPAVFGNDWGLPAAGRRAAKRAALDAGGR